MFMEYLHYAKYFLRSTISDGNIGPGRRNSLPGCHECKEDFGIDIFIFKWEGNEILWIRISYRMKLIGPKK